MYRKIMNILNLLILMMCIVISGVGMWTTPGGWDDAMWTSIWCLSLVTLSDRIDRHN